MYKQLLFARPPMLEKSVLEKKFDLTEVLNNDRTCILENEEVAFSIDKKVIRVFIYNAYDKNLQNTIEDFFYGKGKIRS